MNNNHRITKTIAGAAAVIVLTLTGATAANATTPDGPTIEGGCVDIGYRFIGQYHPEATDPTHTVALDTPIPVGEWLFEVHTSDAYEGRENTTASNSSERVEVLGVVTSDLEDGVPAATGHAEGTVTLDTPLDAVTVEHRPEEFTADSVVADRVCWSRTVTPEPEPEPAPEPVPEPAPVEEAEKVEPAPTDPPQAVSPDPTPPTNTNCTGDATDVEDVNVCLPHTGPGATGLIAAVGSTMMGIGGAIRRFA